MNTVRDRVAMVLAASTGLSLLLLTGAGLWDAFSNPDSQLSEAYSSLLTGTLGVMVGALAGYIGGRGGPVPVIDETDIHRPTTRVSSPDETERRTP